MINKILLVDDDPGAIHVLASMLSQYGPMRFATGGEMALRLVRESAPDLVLLDTDMPDMNGFKVCEAMMADPELAKIPVIFVTNQSEPPYEVAGLALGAADFISKPISEPLLLARVKTQLRIKQLSDELRRMSTIDALTELSNRRRFDELLDREWQRSLRNGDPLSLLMVDVDHFKLFNERYGQAAGDACLRSVAGVLRDVCRRPADDVARIGGEEFALLLPQTTLAGAERIARRAMAGIEALGIPHEASSSLGKHLSVSAGLGYYDVGSPDCLSTSSDSRFGNEVRARPTMQDLLRSADQALYAAKNAGRSQAWRLAIAYVNTPNVARKIPELHLVVPLRAYA